MGKAVTSGVALTEHLPVGETIDFLGKPYRLVREMTRAEYDSHLAQNRETKMSGQAGFYTPSTKQYEPVRTLPEEYRYCYEVEPV